MHSDRDLPEKNEPIWTPKSSSSYVIFPIGMAIYRMSNLQNKPMLRRQDTSGKDSATGAVAETELLPRLSEPYHIQHEW